jgi:hypothetical protein
MRETDYMGHQTGARAAELRRGSVSYISLGSVERYSAEQQAMGSGIWKFRPSCRLTGKPAKTLASQLHQISLSYHRGQISAEQRMAAVDAAIRAAPSLPITQGRE